jgi:hypothetical protein
MRYLIIPLFTLLLACSNQTTPFITIEAEDFGLQEKNEKRSWIIKDFGDMTDTIAASASGSSYIQCVPDTRILPTDKLVHGENFSNVAGEMAVISYSVRVKKPGRYYVWVSCFSTGADDNGIHVGLNGTWPESGMRMQWCEGKHKWTWASKQRTEANHCGEPYKIFLDIEKAGRHTIMFSMREDGFRMDRFLITDDINFTPEIL